MFSHRLFPSELERKAAGFWHGTDFTQSDAPHSWMAEFHADGSVRIKFRDFTQASGAWVVSRSSEETGTWWMQGDIQVLATRRTDAPQGIMARLDHVLQTGVWVRQHSYQILHCDEREMRYEAMEEDISYRSLRSATWLEIPDEPLPPEQWKSKGKRVTI